MSKKSKKLFFITGSRGEWGYIRPILSLIKQNDFFEYSICATNMHLLPSFGESVREIELDGFNVAHKIHMSLDGYNHYTHVKSLGLFLISLTDILASEKPDWIILAGDRGEQLMGGIVGGYTYTPVAHIQAGERSGNIDGVSRHAIGKYAHLHLASNNDAKERLIKLGEEEFRVHNVGAPQLDELVNGEYSTPKEVNKRLNFNVCQDFMMLVQHPVTEEFDIADKQIEETMRAVNHYDLPKVIILPNNDAGSLKVRNGIERFISGKHYIFSNLKRGDYLTLLKHTKVLIGNSSSGLLEAPTFNTPAVNIGRRQNARVQGENVVNCNFIEQEIIEAIEKCFNSEFVDHLKKKCVNPYGDGKSSQRILDIISNIRIDDHLLIKTITY